MMQTAFHYGTEKIVRKFFELYFDEFKLPTNQTVHQYMVNAVKKSQNPEAYTQPVGLDYDRQSDPIKKSLMRQTILSKSSPA